MSEAKAKGFVVSESVLQAQIKHTADFLRRGHDNYLKGKGQGGRVLTAGYALWALHAAGHEPGDNTSAVANYILGQQKTKDHWKQNGRRPPSDGNEFTVTYVALRSLTDFGTPDSSEKTERIRRASEWATNTSPKDTEDAVFRLRIQTLTKADPAILQTSRKELIGKQHANGGWAQLAGMKPDAYATSTVLASLLESGCDRTRPEIRNAIRFLLQNQLNDGTWHVVTRADGFQPYYESGFPHEEDQFISMAASSWAVRALLLSVQPSEAPAAR